MKAYPLFPPSLLAMADITNQSQHFSHWAQIAPQSPSHHSSSGSWYQLFKINTQIKPLCYAYSISCQLFSIQPRWLQCLRFLRSAYGLRLAWLLSLRNPIQHPLACWPLPNGFWGNQKHLPIQRTKEVSAVTARDHKPPLTNVHIQQQLNSNISKMDPETSPSKDIKLEKRQALPQT